MNFEYVRRIASAAMLAYRASRTASRRPKCASDVSGIVRRPPRFHRADNCDEDDRRKDQNAAARTDGESGQTDRQRAGEHVGGPQLFHPVCGSERRAAHSVPEQPIVVEHAGEACDERGPHRNGSTSRHRGPCTTSDDARYIPSNATAGAVAGLAIAAAAAAVPATPGRPAVKRPERHGDTQAPPAYESTSRGSPSTRPMSPNPYASAAAKRDAVLAFMIAIRRESTIPAAPQESFRRANTANAERAASIEAASLENTFAASSGERGFQSRQATRTLAAPAAARSADGYRRNVRAA